MQDLQGQINVGWGSVIPTRFLEGLFMGVLSVLSLCI